MLWIDSESKVKPVVRQAILAYCPDWNDSGYQVCMWDGKVFMFDGQPNDDFHTYVNSWSIFLGAD